MAKITYNNKTDLITQPVPNENKVTASDMNEIKASVNQNVDDIALKADLNGNSLEVFEVADGTISSHSINKGQLDSAISNLQGALIPQGNWDANTNTPDISITTQTGYYWIVNVSGNTNLDGITDWEVNDWAVKTATGWAKIDNTDKVLSVAGKTGVVTLNHNDITDFDTEVSSIISTDVDKAFVDALGINATQLNGQNASFYQNASNINSGTLADARLSSNVVLANNTQTITGTKTVTSNFSLNTTSDFAFQRLLNFGAVGAWVRNIATFQNVNAGVTDNRFNFGVKGTDTSYEYAYLGFGAFNDSNVLKIYKDGTITGNGSGLTNLNATNISTGTLADARLSSNVALLDATQTFTGVNTFNDNLFIEKSLFIQDIAQPNTEYKIQSASGSFRIIREDSGVSSSFLGFQGDNIDFRGTSHTINHKLDFSLISGSSKTFLFQNTSGTIALTKDVGLGSYTVATLPTPTAPAFAYVTDSADTITYRSTVTTGGGSGVALVFYDGTNWIYH